jgi:L-aminopeptidase/D-esterase-like protein
MSGTPTDVAGLTAGHWTDTVVATGRTVVLCGADGAAAGASRVPLVCAAVPFDPEGDSATVCLGA